MRAPRAIRRTVERFFEDPASVRNAAWLVVGATVIAVVVGGVVERVFDRKDFPNIGRALWFTLQTVTTVGYGDVTPTHTVGRVVAAVVMLTGIGFITVVTAAVTSTFIEATRRRAANIAFSADEAETARLLAELAAMNTRLDQIENAIGDLVEWARPR
jgi:voltage-gated potassium channel